MSESSDKDQTANNSNISTFITGAVVGAVVTYLFTTESGRKIKDELIKEGSKLLESVGDELEKVKDRAEDEGEKLLEEVKEKKKEIDTEVQTAAKQVKKQAQEKVSEVVENVEEIPQQVAEIQKKGRRFFFSKKPSSHES